MSKFIDKPLSISINTIIDNNFILSSSKYSSFIPNNNNLIEVKDFLEEVTFDNKGIEVGGNNYVNKSNYKFIKTKAMQSYSFLIELSEKSFEYVVPTAYKDFNLKKGQILIAKDCKVEPIILERDYYDCMISSGIYKLEPKKYGFYLFAFMKSSIFQEQLEFMIARGANRRHAGLIFLNCKIPVPNIEKENTIKYVELLVQAIVNKETMIIEHYNKIILAIDSELKNNQKVESFSYRSVTNKDILETKQKRLDSSLYTKEFKEKEFIIRNYKYGYYTMDDENFEFTMDRGQNLQISQVGKSIYSDTYIDNFCTLINPTNISNYGIVQNLVYVGNKNLTNFLEYGDIIFGAEGTFRSLVILDDTKNIITNIHGLIIHHKKENIEKSIFLKCYLDYLKETGLINSYAAGGRGGSLSPEYWTPILFPKFQKEKELEICKYYHNKELEKYTPKQCNMDNFLDYDNKYNEFAGIVELDKSAKILKNYLNDVLKLIKDDKVIETNFKSIKERT